MIPWLINLNMGGGTAVVEEEEVSRWGRMHPLPPTEEDLREWWDKYYDQKKRQRGEVPPPPTPEAVELVQLEETPRVDLDLIADSVTREIAAIQRAHDERRAAELRAAIQLRIEEAEAAELLLLALLSA